MWPKFSFQFAAIFLLDIGYKLWLWQGWFPESPESSDEVSSGSRMVRWHAERRAAMQTASDYGRILSPASGMEGEVVWAGHEPIEFTNLFPAWTKRKDVEGLNAKVPDKKSTTGGFVTTPSLSYCSL